MRCNKRPVALFAALTLPLALGACSEDAEPEGSEVLKVGFITKFPVDFYDIMVEAVEAYDAEHADVEVVFGQGKSGTDDEGVINTIENMIAQNVKAIGWTLSAEEIAEIDGITKG